MPPFEKAGPPAIILPKEEVEEPLPVRTVDPGRPMVALTFDDGPHGTYTVQILDILEEYGAVATFFEVAFKLSKAPDAARVHPAWAVRSAVTPTATPIWVR